MFEHGFRLLTLHAGKPLDKVVEASTALEVFEERAHRNAGAPEDPHAPDLSRDTFHGGTLGPVKHVSRIPHAQARSREEDRGDEALA